MTTAMAVMPHTDSEKAIQLALSLDIPFWPQLPMLSYYEDMYVQASEHFPGIVLDLEVRRLSFSMEKFLIEMEEALRHFDEPSYFDISPRYSSVYHRFLELDLSLRPAIKGQLEGPISFGLNVADENKRPILFHDTVRAFMLEFMAKRVNVQLSRLKQKNQNAFMFVDEPGLQFVFSGLSGYDDRAAHKDMELFFSMIERPRGVHLCGKPDWDFLLSLDPDVLSLDIYTNHDSFLGYSKAIKRFIERGGILVWGLVPTNFEPFQREDISSLEAMLERVWERLVEKGIDKEELVEKSLLSPATCCLVNPDREKTVEKAFGVVRDLSMRLRERYGLV
jgi:hypothetical protein